VTHPLDLVRLGLEVLAAATTAYVALYYLTGLAMVVAAALESLRQSRRRPREVPEAVAEADELPGVSVLIPAFNEEAAICRTVESVLGTLSPDLEIIVVSDGSTDRTLAVLSRRFGLRLTDEEPLGSIPTQAVRAVFRSRSDPRLLVVDKRNGGKADALNVGINFASKPLVCAIDADVILQPWALVSLALPFARDEDVVASSGTIRLQNGCRIQNGQVAAVGLPGSTLERIQVVEYVRAFCLGRLFFNLLDAHLIISGAFGLFRRPLLAELGGFQPNAIGEDMELVLRIHRHLRERGARYRIVFVADAVCFTEAPHALRDLGRQRTRWHQGLLTSLRLHRRMMLRPSFGSVGLLAWPYYVFFELLSPIAEAFGWLLIPAGVASGLLDPVFLAAFFGVAFCIGTATSWLALLFDDLAGGFFPRFSQVLALSACAVLEHLGYHQATLYFRLRAFVRYYSSIHVRGGWISPRRRSSPGAP
jgi:cellulose synthase/poly-beta-1,6-N-acetylglucosamine synthase-like glycosyltransferase